MIIEEETGVPFDDVLEEVIKVYKPMDTQELSLVHRIAICLWRLARAHTIERMQRTKSSLSRGPEAFCRNILIYDRLMDIQLQRAVNALEKKRKKERARRRS